MNLPEGGTALCVRVRLGSSPDEQVLAASKSRQSCPTLCDPIDGGPPGSHPWDSPGKPTGVGFHFLLYCMKGKSESEIAQSCPTATSRPHGL